MVVVDQSLRPMRKVENGLSAVAVWITPPAPGRVQPIYHAPPKIHTDFPTQHRVMTKRIAATLVHAIKVLDGAYENLKDLTGCCLTRLNRRSLRDGYFASSSGTIVCARV